MPVVFSMPYEHAHTPCGHSHYVLWAFPLCPVGIPIMPCGHSQSPYFILCPIHLQPALWAYLHGDPYALWAFPSCPWHSLYALWAFPLCPVGIHITPCGHSHYSPWALPSRNPNPHFILCPICLWSSVCPAYPHGHPYAQWAFPLCPVGIPIMPCGHFPTATDALGFSVTWFSHRPWKVLEFEYGLENCLIFQSALKIIIFFLETAWKWL